MGRVVYAGFATPQHSGGGHVLTQHVQLLRAAGEDAWLWLPDPEVRPSWIAAQVPILAGATIGVDADDLLVLPEVPVVPGRDPAPGARKVIFNQNHFYTFAAGGSDSAPYPGWSPEPPMWVVSVESRDVLSALMPGRPLAVVPNAIDGQLFRRRPTDRPRVAWFPRKRPREAALLGRLLARDPRLAEVDQTALVDTPRQVVAQVLGTTTVFVSLGHSEGFGLTVAEAMASECLVVGYDGGGGHELFEAPGVQRIPDQRPLLLADAVVSAVQRAPERADDRAGNRTWVLERYSVARTSSALLDAVARARRLPGAAATARHPAAWLDALGPNFTAYA